jgi:hypothetical protein
MTLWFRVVAAFGTSTRIKTSSSSSAGRSYCGSWLELHGFEELEPSIRGGRRRDRDQSRGDDAVFQPNVQVGLPNLAGECNHSVSDPFATARRAEDSARAARLSEQEFREGAQHATAKFNPTNPSADADERMPYGLGGRLACAGSNVVT